MDCDFGPEKLPSSNLDHSLLGRIRAGMPMHLENSDYTPIKPDSIVGKIMPNLSKSDTSIQSIQAFMTNNRLTGAVSQRYLRSHPNQIAYALREWRQRSAGSSIPDGYAELGLPP
jgi:hypothetical protein